MSYILLLKDTRSHIAKGFYDRGHKYVDHYKNVCVSPGCKHVLNITNAILHYFHPFSLHTDFAMKM